MKFRCFGSGSRGNGYCLQSSSGDILMIEAGIDPKEVFRHIQVDKVCGLLVSHRHGDHAKYIPQYLLKNVDVYANPDTVKMFVHNGQHSRMLHTFPDTRYLQLGRFEVVCFDLLHDAPCTGFLIKHPEMDGLVMFVTDTSEVPISTSGISCLLIEADYDYNILKDNVDNGKVNVSLARRITQTHLSVYQTEQYCRICKNGIGNENMRNIVLLHLSSQNSQPEAFRDRVTESTGIPAYIAEKGMNIEIGKEIF